MTPLDGGNRKSRILEAAREEFASQGFVGARVARIARRAGVNKQLLYYYFRSKSGLHRAVMAEAVVPHHAPQAAGPATDQLRASIRGIFAALERKPELIALLFEPSSTARGTAGEVLEGLERPLREIVSTGQGLGYFRDDVDPELAAREGVILCAGYLGIEPVLEGERHERRTAWVDAVAALLTKGLAW